MNILGIIPARSGSKQLKKKNIKNLLGYPLLAYSILAARMSKKISKVICSTDSNEIGKIAKKFGAEVPFLRPKNISLDSSGDIEFILYTLKKIDPQKKIDVVALIRPTSPLRPKNFIDNAIKKFQKHPKADSLRTISDVDHSPFKMWKKKGNYLSVLLSLKNNSQPFNSNRQFLPKVYAQTGHLDLIKTKTIFKYKDVSGKKILHYYLKKKYFVDIDDLESFKLVESRIKKINCIKFVKKK